MIVFGCILCFVILEKFTPRGVCVKFFLKYKKFWEEGDHEAFTSIIDPEFEIIMHPTGGAINYDLWMQKDYRSRAIQCLCGKN